MGEILNLIEIINNPVGIICLICFLFIGALWLIAIFFVKLNKLEFKTEIEKNLKDEIEKVEIKIEGKNFIAF